jgi:hypothetical protein
MGRVALAGWVQLVLLLGSRDTGQIWISAIPSKKKKKRGAQHQRQQNRHQQQHILVMKARVCRFIMMIASSLQVQRLRIISTELWSLF